MHVSKRDELTQRLKARLVQELGHGAMNCSNLKEGPDAVVEDMCVVFDGAGEKVEVGEGMGEGGFERVGEMERVMGVFERVEEEEGGVSKGRELIKN